jgi:hypothetical protein
MARWQRATLVLLAAVAPLYVALYFRGYERPAHHPPSAGVYESVRVGLEAQAMAFGPAATGPWLWPTLGVVLLLVGSAVTARLVSRLRSDGVRAAGLLLYLAAGAAVAFGIGWGRSGFYNDMGFAWRYGWVTAPAVWAGYFTCVLWGGRVSVYGPWALLAAAVVVTPINTVSGFRHAERNLRPFAEAWQADVQAGMAPGQLVRKHFPEVGPAAWPEMVDALRVMRAHRYTYYESLGAEEP